eukprot:TRINITY_DN595_c1_g3_i1.p1 TRINITY_DN595_c1_g3~~TRINITY_DN595_c1_g3_i1.p1  ORF type:complete len:392 (+),score=39.15 TRINITY_DN595_c1_g3_i1:228-1403(+)
MEQNMMQSKQYSLVGSTSKRRSLQLEPEHLFETPGDLVCPITHEIFVDPVITCAGQVYERSAIEQYIRQQQNPVDPVTRSPLVSRVLTPVHVFRGRALEFREDTAKQCVDYACSAECTNPAKFLRRACELCAGVKQNVPGLSPECIEYFQGHNSNAYDHLGIQIFAQGLLRQGYKEKAASVYYGLIRAGEDKAQKTKLLKECLNCWKTDQDYQDSVLLNRLTKYVIEQESFTMTQIIDVMNEAGLDRQLVLRLCVKLIEELDSWEKQKEVLMKYILMSCKDLDDRVDLLEFDVRKFKQQAQEEIVKRDVQRERAYQGQNQGQGQGQNLGWKRGGGWRSKKVLGCVLFGIGCAIPVTNPVLKATQFASAAFLFVQYQASHGSRNFDEVQNNN